MLPARAVEVKLNAALNAVHAVRQQEPGYAGRFLGWDTNVALNCTECVAKLKEALIDVSPGELRLNSAVPAPDACLGGALGQSLTSVMMPGQVPPKACMWMYVTHPDCHPHIF